MATEPQKIVRLSRAQVREIDRISIERYHIPGSVLMENASRGATDVAMQMLAGIASPRVLIFCGGGNNGGDGLAIARHLHNRHVDVQIIRAFDELRGDALINWNIAQAMHLAVESDDDAVTLLARPHDLIIDALLGTGLESPPRERMSRLIRAINARPIASALLAIDVPSGLDCDTGLPLGGECIRATRTVTFVAEKIGFARASARAFLGDVTVADIGCPRELITI